VKRCPLCGEVKVHAEFHRNKASPDGYQVYCKTCRKAYDHDYHVRVQARRRQQKREARIARNAWLRELREGKPCTDCGVIYPPEAMHWDHLPGSEKLGEISGTLRNNGPSKILAEIGKCELVCANCHAIRTYRRLHGLAEDAAEYAVGLAA
jgi:hypothetical protein